MIILRAERIEYASSHPMKKSFFYTELRLVSYAAVVAPRNE